jgi:hypothetical protein
LRKSYVYDRFRFCLMDMTWLDQSIEVTTEVYLDQRTQSRSTDAIYQQYLQSTSIRDWLSRRLWWLPSTINIKFNICLFYNNHPKNVERNSSVHIDVWVGGDARVFLRSPSNLSFVIFHRSRHASLTP